MNQESSIMIPMPTMEIHDDHIDITIRQWDELTIQILESYTKHKINAFNNNNGSKQQTTDKPLSQSAEPKKQKCTEKNKIGKNIKYPDLTILSNQYTTPIYQETIDYCLEHLEPNFTMSELKKVIHTFYKNKLKQPIKETSAKTYATEYKKYMLDRELIIQKNNNIYTIKTKDEVPPEICMIR